MAGETILVVDAGKEIDEKMTSALEAEGYLIYPVSSQDVNAEMAALLKPSLMFVKPPDLKPTGLDPCKAIHGIPLLMKVPIILLASLKKPLGPQYLEEYGIVDYLEPTFSKEELIEKIGTILVKTLFSSPPDGEKTVTSGPVRRTEKKRPPLFLGAVGIVAVLVIAGAAYMAYQQFMPGQKVPPPRPAKGTIRVSSVAPKAGLKPQSPPASSVAKTPANNATNDPANAPVNTPEKTPASTPANAAVSTPPTTSANAAANTPANPPVPASSVSSTPPVKPSSASQENASEATRKPFYSVQLGAFRDEEMAQALAKKFQGKGYDAFTQPGVTKDKSPVYRVLVNKYEDRKAAQKMAGEIQIKEQVKTTLYGD